MIKGRAQLVREGKLRVSTSLSGSRLLVWETAALERAAAGH